MGPSMQMSDLRQGLQPEEAGNDMYRMISELYPLCRSLTGDGVRRTLASVARVVPLDMHEVPSGTQVFDWTIPNEWNVRDAWVKDRQGRRVIDFQVSNLHLLSYSVPIHRRVTLTELKEHLFTLPDRPDWIPYRTSYYTDNWGFCLSQRQMEALEDDEYEVCIDATLEPGHLTYGECYLPGQTQDEVLLTTHICHPSLANDNLSGISLLAWLGARLSGLSLRYSYRLLFIPGTLGSITWLARNEAATARIKHGIVLSGVGDPGPLTYKRSRQGAADIDRCVAYVLGAAGDDHAIIDFTPYGYDERQFCSPGFDLPVGRLGRTPHGEYPEYHTSADDLEFVRPQALGDSLAKLLDVLAVVEDNRRFRNLKPMCEPQLGRRGLYRAIGATIDHQSVELGFLWMLNLSDGDHSVLDIARRSGLSFEMLVRAADLLLTHGLLEEVGDKAA